MEHIALKNCLALNFLHELFPDSSANMLRSWIKAARVCVNGEVVRKANTPLVKGDVIAIGPKVHFLRQGIKILFEDEDLIVLEKPEGMLSVATDFDKTTSVHAILKKRFHKQRVFPVHRLDRETSGVMVFAYSDHARKRLKEQFEAHSIDKVYYAIVEGKLPAPKGVWESYLEEDAFYSVHVTAEPGRGKPAITHYEKVMASEKFTMVRLKPITGKKHQLRVHCKAAGVPILGDKRYGKESGYVKRLYLHAQKVAFTHPSTQKRMHFEVPIPQEFEDKKLIAIENCL